MFTVNRWGNRRGPSRRYGRAALKDTLPLWELQRELQREMEQDCTAAAHQQQDTCLKQACLLACSSRERQCAHRGTPF
eukprot:scaffold46841_cov18-Tisochrysis_lutea.AAC.2